MEQRSSMDARGRLCLALLACAATGAAGCDGAPNPPRGGAVQVARVQLPTDDEDAGDGVQPAHGVDGLEVGSEIALGASEVTRAAGSQRSPDVAWDGSAHLAVWSDDRNGW